ncbi:hypothetical protein, partial [Shewanella algae]|uniref:hypothetical protein n=1 Tax=Shewanella algae TaxID=38313 RepID=UPI001C926670
GFESCHPCHIPDGLHSNMRAVFLYGCIQSFSVLDIKKQQPYRLLFELPLYLLNHEQAGITRCS